jgi:hypothetical protein
VVRASELAQDIFGNYVVQKVLDLKRPHYNARIAYQFIDEIANLKLSKPVIKTVEKCLMNNSRDV